jgi:aromatic ring-cleaving dioxygenase
MSEDQFTKLFKHMSEQFVVVNAKLDEKASQSSMDRLTNTVDKFIGRLDDADIENAARDSQFAKLLEWAKKVSEKTGIPLENL